MPFTIVLISLISTMVNGTLLNFVKRYKDDLRVIFDQWPKLHLGLDALSNQKILNGVYSVAYKNYNLLEVKIKELRAKVKWNHRPQIPRKQSLSNSDYNLSLPSISTIYCHLYLHTDWTVKNMKLFPNLCTDWFLEKTTLCKICVSGTVVLMTQLIRDPPLTHA